MAPLLVPSAGDHILSNTVRQPIPLMQLSARALNKTQEVDINSSPSLMLSMQYFNFNCSDDFDISPLMEDMSIGSSNLSSIGFIVIQIFVVICWL